MARGCEQVNEKHMQTALPYVPFKPQKKEKDK